MQTTQNAKHTPGTWFPNTSLASLTKEAAEIAAMTPRSPKMGRRLNRIRSDIAAYEASELRAINADLLAALLRLKEQVPAQYWPSMADAAIAKAEGR